MSATDPLTAYYTTEYHRRNMQVARVCGAQAAVDQALERALSVKSIPAWLIAYLESAATRLPGLQHDLAAWRDLAPDAPDTVQRATPLAAALAVPEVKALFGDVMEYLRGQAPGVSSGGHYNHDLRLRIAALRGVEGQP